MACDDRQPPEQRWQVVSREVEGRTWWYVVHPSAMHSLVYRKEETAVRMCRRMNALTGSDVPAVE